MKHYSHVTNSASSGIGAWKLVIRSWEHLPFSHPAASEYSSKLSHHGLSNSYSQNIFSRAIRKIFYYIPENSSYQELGFMVYFNSGSTVLGKSISKYIFFLFLKGNICCGYSLEAPRRGASNEYPQHMFSWRNKKNINNFV